MATRRPNAGKAPALNTDEWDPPLYDGWAGAACRLLNVATRTSFFIVAERQFATRKEELTRETQAAAREALAFHGSPLARQVLDAAWSLIAALHRDEAATLAAADILAAIAAEAIVAADVEDKQSLAARQRDEASVPAVAGTQAAVGAEARLAADATDEESIPVAPLKEASYLQLIVDSVSGEVRRDGCRCMVPLSPGSAELHTFLVAYRAGETGATKEQWLKSYPGDISPVARRNVKSRLNGKLEVLQVALASRIPPKLISKKSTT